MNKTELYNHLKDQFDRMLKSGIIPVIEEQILIDGELDYLTINIDISEKGFIFEFDDRFDVSFGGEIKKIGDCYLLPFDEYFDDIDHYLQMISDNIMDGYILPNNLLYSGDQ